MMHQPAEEEIGEDATLDSGPYSVASLANLYLYHVLSWHWGNPVVTHDGDMEPYANEKIMRYLENESGIGEKECVSFREKVALHVCYHRMDFMYEKMGLIFEYAIKFHHDMMVDWIDAYPNAITFINYCSMRR
jgi:hypothetical protein